jgi:glutathionylspermidine synthase
MNPFIDHYHSLLTPEVAQASHAMLEEQLRSRGLIFGDRALCTVLRPRLMTPEQLSLLERRVAALTRAFRKAGEAALKDPKLRAQFRLADWEEQLVRDDPGFRAASPSSRLDAFVMDDAGTMALTEYNAETPAGAGFHDALSDAFVDLPVMRAFARRYALRSLPARHHVGHAVLEAWREFSGQWALPRVAIVDWEDVPTRNEFVLFQEYFRGLGISCEITTPEALEYRRGQLVGPAGPIDVIYKRVLIHELVERCGLDHPMIRAVRERATCMVNPFRCKILHKKASLAVLSDEANASLFDAADRAAISAHIPWTRVVEPRQTTHGGTTVDLLAHIESNRERLVLKPNDDYGGAGIVLGWTVGADEWRQGIARAVAEPYIVQERVPIPSEPYPSLVDGKVEVVDRMLDTAPFVVHGDYMEGAMTRLSTAALLNVTAGGGSTVPTFIVEKR